MDYQQGFNIAMTLVAFLGGYVLNQIRESIKSLQRADEVITEKVHRLETLVVGDYVKHSDIEKLGDAIFRKLDKIETKLDGKQDKPP